MGENNKKRTKRKLVYINFFSQPSIKDRNTKLLRYGPFFDFLFLLKDRIEILVIDHIGISESFIHDGIRFQYFRKSNRKWSIPCKALWSIRRSKPDVVYVQGLSYPHFVILMALFLKPGTRILVHDHANSMPYGWKKWIFKMADRSIDHYFFTSKNLADPWIEGGLISTEQKIIECVEGSTKFAFDPSVEKEKNSFLWVGRLDINKDPMTILRAFSQYLQENPYAKLTMFYEDTTLLNDVEVFIEEHRMAQSVHLMGQVANKELETWYQRSSYFILGSHKEGGPISLIEAMACGCIPIVTNIPAFQSMVGKDDCGFLFEPGDLRGLVKVLGSLNEADHESIRKKVLDKFERELSHKAIASKIEQASKMIS